MKDRQKNIVIATRVFVPEPAIAAEMQYSFAHTLKEAGYKVKVLTTTSPGYSNYSNIDVPVYRWPALRDKDGYIKGILQYLSFDIPLFFRILFTFPKPDLVIVEPPPTTGIVTRFACTIRRIPYIYRVADLWSEAVTDADAGKIIQKLLRLGEIWALRGAKLLMPVHAGISEQVEKMPLSTPLQTIGLGVNTKIYTATGSQQQELPNKRILLYAGTASHVHGAEIFVEAFSLIKDEFPDVELVFIGQGTTFPWLYEQAAKPKSRITVLPRMKTNETAEWIRASVASLASVKPGPYSFAFPTKAYASIACGIPVIYTGAKPAGDIIADAELGWVADYNPQAVAKAMQEALTEKNQLDTKHNKEKLQRWAQENVSLDTIAQRVRHIVDRLTNTNTIS